MRFYSVSELAIFCKKSERTIYRKLEGLELDPSDIEEDPRRYSENVLKLLQGKQSTTAKDIEINSLKREIETLKSANSELSKMTQNAFDSLQEEQKQVTELTESLKASQSLQLVAEQRAKELEEKINLLTAPADDQPKRKKKKKKKGKKLF